MIGKKILNYKIHSPIGEGGMGNVYLGEHESIGRKVAIKMLKPELASNQEIHNRFKNEAAVMAKLQHPNLVGLIDYVEEEEGLYLIMEYVEGKGLDEVLKGLEQPMSIDRANGIMKQILKGFAYAHECGVVHRDVKPANILLTDKDEVKVLDFGIAKLVGDVEFNLTKTGTQVGTVYYMSPEQVKAKELDKRSDIYSLGVTYYELLAGFCPYSALTSEYDVYDQIMKEPLKSLTATMGGVYKNEWEVVQKATEKNPNNRFQNCEEFGAMLAGGTVSSEPKPVVVKQEEEEEKKKGFAWWYVAVGVAAIAILIFLFMPGGDESESESDGVISENTSNNREAEEDNDDLEYVDDAANPHSDIQYDPGADTIVELSGDFGELGDIAAAAAQADEVMEFPDVEASYRGGQAAMQRFIANNVVYPETAIEMNEQGRVYLSFVVEMDGRITHIQVERGVSDEIDREAKRVIRKMPRWTPGEVSGRAVRTRCRLPIVFTLD